MNEQIKQLAEQAGYHPDIYELCKPGMEKFAELIILKCIEINKDLLHGEVEINSHRRSHNNALEESNFYIKRHFGVKE